MSLSSWTHPHSDAVTGVEWYPIDTGLFVSSSFDRTLKIWDANRQEVATQFNLDQKLFACAMSPLATAHLLVAVAHGSGSIRLCDVISGSQSHSLVGHKREAVTVHWSPTSQFMLASGSLDQTIRLWDIRKAGCLMTFDAHNRHASLARPTAKTLEAVQSHKRGVCHVQFTRNGLQLISSGLDGRLVLWDVATGRNSLVHFPHTGNPSLPYRFALSECGEFVFSPDGADVAMCAVATGKLIRRLKGVHLRNVCCITTTTDTQEVFSAGHDASIVAWSPKSLRLEQEPNPQDDEWK